jgi:hypothetical protein
MIDDDCGAIGAMRINKGNGSTRRKSVPSASLSTTNPTSYPGSNLGRRGAKPATNRLSYGTVKKKRHKSQNLSISVAFIYFLGGVICIYCCKVQQNVFFLFRNLPSVCPSHFFQGSPLQHGTSFSSLFMTQEITNLDSV